MISKILFKQFEIPKNHFKNISKTIPTQPSQLSITNKQIYKIFKENRSQIAKIIKNAKSPLEEMKDKYVYDIQSFQIVNNDKFLEQIIKLEQSKLPEKHAQDGHKFPFLLLFFTIFIYYQWQSIPYKVMYQHATINDYIYLKNYYHSLFTAALSHKSTENFIMYALPLFYSINLCGFYMKQRHMFYLFASNALFTAGFTFLYEKFKSDSINFIPPKANGAVTPLAFTFAFLALNPDYAIFKQKRLPFYIIPAFYFMYECFQLKNNTKSDTCVPAHFSAMIYGVLFGLAFKRIM